MKLYYYENINYNILVHKSFNDELFVSKFIHQKQREREREIKKKTTH